MERITRRGEEDKQLMGVGRTASYGSGVTVREGEEEEEEQQQMEAEERH